MQGRLRLGGLWLPALLILGTTAVLAQAPGLAPPPDLASPPPDAVKSPSGLVSKVISAGAGADRPAATDVVTVHYTGWSSDGEVFDSSHTRGTPSTFPLNRVMAGWRECVQLMTVGERRRCWIPEELAYRGQPGRPRGTVVFDIELLDTRPSPAIPPPDVKEPPPDATRTPSGLAYKVLRPGTGTRNPGRFSRVTVHYTGWTTDGKMFDTSLTRGGPVTMRLDEVIPGWTEGVTMMVEGERRRLWIPQQLAYKGQPGAPRGMLVFDIELVQIE
ncbi:MAG TPA: FKBP-type peptidyl-prolyl cis-trans isomerase [Vicinamibacterales bacterium]|nr:FKBP-type peptidyl-prolyl cis-trans isomerase [Vicinamibacterales bacterium]